MALAGPRHLRLGGVWRLRDRRAVASGVAARVRGRARARDVAARADRYVDVPLVRQPRIEPPVKPIVDPEPPSFQPPPSSAGRGGAPVSLREPEAIHRAARRIRTFLRLWR